MAYPYKAQAILKYKPPPGTTNGLILAKGDVIDVLNAEDDDGDWLRGRKADGTEGVFPEQFVEAMVAQPEPSSDLSLPPPEQSMPNEAKPASPVEQKAIVDLPVKVPASPKPTTRKIAPSSPKVVPTSPKPAAARLAPAATQSSSTQGDEKSNMSFKDRLAAFNKPAAAAPPAPRPKPAGFTRKPVVPTASPDPAIQAVVPQTATASTEKTPQVEASNVEPARSGSMSPEDAASSIKQGGSLKERMAALQGLSLEGPGMPGRAPRPWRKAPADESSSGADEAAAPQSPVPNDKTIALPITSEEETQLAPAEPSSPVQASLMPTSVSLPAAPKRAAGPRRKAPSAASSIEVPPKQSSEPNLQLPVTDEPNPMGEGQPIPSNATQDSAEKQAVEEQTPSMPSPRQVGLGAATEQPGAEAEMDVVTSREDEHALAILDSILDDNDAAIAAPSGESHDGLSSMRNEIEAGTVVVDAPLLAAVNADQPPFHADDDEDIAVVPPDSQDVLDEDVANVDLDQQPVVTAREQLKPEEDPGNHSRRGSSAHAELSESSNSPRGRDVPSPKGPRMFGSVSDGSPSEKISRPINPGQTSTFRPPPVPAPFVRQATAEALPTRSAQAEASAIITEARAPSIPGSEVPQAPVARSGEDKDTLQQPFRSASLNTQASDNESNAPISRKTSAAESLPPPSRNFSQSTHSSASMFAENDPSQTAAEADVDPEVARRQALVKRMAALGGVKMGIMPMFGRAPRQNSGSSAAPSEEVPVSPIEKSSDHESDHPPSSPRRIPGLPTGAVPIFGMARPQASAQRKPSTDRETSPDPTGRRSVEPDVPARRLSLPPQNRPPPPIPMQGMSSGTFTDEPEGADEEAEVPAEDEEDALPMPPPVQRPIGGHASRGSIDAGQARGAALQSPTIYAGESPGIPNPPMRPAGGHAPAMRTSIDEYVQSPPIPGDRPPPVPGHRPDNVASPRTEANVSAFDSPQQANTAAFVSHPRQASDAAPGSVASSSSPKMPLAGRFAGEAPPLPNSPARTSLPSGADALRSPRQPLSAAELSDLSERIGASLFAKAARKAKEGARADRDAVAFVSSLISEIPDAAPPPTQGGGFGIRIWMSSSPDADAAAGLIRPGDVFVVEGRENVKIKGKGLAASSTILQPGYAAIVEEDFDLRKRKLKVIEIGDKGRIDHASHSLDSVKGGAVSVYRVLDRAHA